MGQISAGMQFGHEVARPRLLNEVALPRAAFGVPNAIQREGERQVAEGVAVEHEQAQQRQAYDRTRAAADSAQASAALKGLQVTIDDTMREIADGIVNGTLPKDQAGQQWRERTAEIISEGLGEVPQAYRAAVQQDLNLTVRRLDSNVRAAITHRDRQDVTAGLTQTLEYLQRDYFKDPARATQSAMEAIDQLGPHSTLAPDARARLAQGWKESTQFAAGTEAISQARNSRAALDLAEKKLATLTDLDPQRRVALQDRIAGYRMHLDQQAIVAANRVEIEAAKRDREAARSWEVLSGWAMAGKVADPQASAGLIAKLNGTPYAAAYQALIADAPQRTAVAVLPLAEQQARLDALKARAVKGTSQALEAEIKRSEQVLTEARKDYAAEPLRAGSERGIIEQPAPLNTGTIDGLVAGLAARIEQAQAVATKTGQPVSPLLSEEAGRLGDMLSTIPPAQRSRYVAQVAAILPPGMASAMATQIDKKDRALALALSMGESKATESRYASELVFKGQQARIDGTSTKGDKAADVKAASWRAHAAVALEGVFENTETTAQVRDAAEFIMHGIAAENSGRLTRDDMDHAIGLALGGTLVEHNGRKIPLPAGIDEDILDTRLRSATVASDIKRQAFVPRADGQPQDMDKVTVRAGGVAVPVAEFVRTLPGQQLVPVRPGQFAVLVGRRPVVNTRGDAIIITVK